MKPLAGGMIERIVVKQQHGFGAKRVGIHFGVVGVGMVGPVLLHPQPLAAADQVGKDTEKVIDPRAFGTGSVIGIVLDIHTNHGLGDAKDQSHSDSGALKRPEVLKVAKERTITSSAKEPSNSSEFFAATDNLEDFAFDFAFKLGVKLVVAHKVCDLAHTLHLFQVLVRMIGMNHFVLNRHIVSTKDLNGVTTGVIKVIEIVNGSVNANFIALERTQTSNALRLCRLGGAVQSIVGSLALAQLVGVRRHCIGVGL